MSIGNARPRAKKSFGQNFLIDGKVVSDIIAAVAPASGDLIFEIGPGQGALTEELVASGADVVAIELDRDLIEPLRLEFGGKPNFHLRQQDALAVNFPEIFAELNLPIARLGRVKLVANLPYYISTAILQRLAEQREFFTSIVLMFQREVVERLTAAPGNSERGFLTVLTESAFEVERLIDVPPQAFRPVPKVASAVVRLSPKRKEEEEENLRLLLSRAFGQKRKTIANNLKTSYAQYGEALEAAAIDPKRRAEDLSLEEWQRLNSALLAVG